ncbi:hypothetical protein [Uliginosibacterium sp. H1]|uniref:hypothetical protein n=1 Tax=Uliginosibacterium sp. H1 TaxID=3114757 RepID=UPI002E17E1D8|nr:hypothetical protein [Uliginosibacterium sp. H1]
MSKRWLHLVDHSGIYCYRIDGAHLTLADYFPVDEEGQLGFGYWVQQRPRGDIHSLVVDLPDEGFHLDPIPYVIGADRKALIQRKLVQHFFGSPYATAISLGREKTGRRDERVLFAAITRPAAIEPWLTVLRSAGAALRAVHAVPLLTRDLLAGLKLPETRGLVIALSPSGIRQLYFDDGQLRFARLSPAPDGPYANWGPDCLREARKTYQYISAQRWIPRNNPLTVYVLACRNEEQALTPQLAGGEPLDFQTVALESVFQRLSVREPVTDSNSRALFLRLAQRARAEPQLAPESERRYFRVWQARSAVFAAGMLALFGFGLAAGKAWFDARELRLHAQETRLDTQREERRYDQLLASLPKLPAPLDTLRGVVDNLDQVAAQRNGPRPLLALLSQSLERFPDVELQRLDWQAGPRGDGPTGTTPATTTSPHAVNESSLVVEASLPEGSAGDPRGAIERIRALVADLQQNPGIEVSRLRQPFDIESDKTLKSDSNSARSRPQFSFQITSRPPAAAAASQAGGASR